MEIWILDLEALGADRYLEQMMTLLTPADREKALCYRFRPDRLRCAAGRLMIRLLAKRTAGRDLPVLLAPGGKPYFAAADAPSFSLSHSGRMVVLAHGDAPLGVDVEQALPLDWRALSAAFSPGERALLSSSPDPLALFYRIWTAREALAKREGTGLPLFEDLPVSVDPAAGAVSFRGQRLPLLFRDLPKGFTLCLCAANARQAVLRPMTDPDLRAMLLPRDAQGTDLCAPRPSP